MKIAALSLLLFSGACLADVNVDLYYQGRLLLDIKLDGTVRLDELLRNGKLPQDIYWRSAQISTPKQHGFIEYKRNTLLRELATLERIWRTQGEPERANSAKHLSQQLADLNLTGRLPVIVDPNWVQRDLSYNPRLEGSYQLYLAPRQPYLAFIGLMNGLSVQPLQAGAGIDSYWRRDALLAGADPANVWLIQPTGEIEQVPVAVWNKRHREPMAGATMLVGFDTRQLPSAFEGINQRIVEIVTNRAPF